MERMNCILVIMYMYVYSVNIIYNCILSSKE